ncbi:MAG: mechanosensitive ion channel family protein [Bacteroidota bacterium]
MFEKIITQLTDNKAWLDPLLQVSFIVLCTMILHINYKRASNFLASYSPVPYLLLQAFYLPLLAFIFLTCAKIIIPYLDKIIPQTLKDIGGESIEQVAWFAIFIWFTGRFTSMVKNYILSNKGLIGPFSKKAVYWVFEMFYWTLILIFVLGSLSILKIKVAQPLRIFGHGIIIWSFTIAFLYTTHVGLAENIKVFSEKNDFLVAAILKAIWSPLLAVIFGTGMLLFFDIAEFNKNKHFASYQLDFSNILIPCFFWTLFRLASLIERDLLIGRLTTHYPDKTRVQAIGKFARIVTIIFAALFLFPSQDTYQEIYKVIVGSGLIIGIAARTIIGNYLSGFVMNFEGNFKVGDWIYSTDKQVEGVIEYMGMRTTTLRTFDKRVLYIPNSFFSTANLVNASKMTNRRIDEIIPIERVAPDKIDKITQELRNMLQSHPDIDPYLSSMAHMTTFGPSSLNVSIRAFTKTKDLKTYRSICQDLFLKVMQIMEKHGATLAPTNILPKEDSKKMIKGSVVKPS